MSGVELLPIFEDNYVFAIPCGNGEVLLVDPGDGVACLRWLKERRWILRGILLTHHHQDHIGGLDDLLSEHRAPVWGPAANTLQIPALTNPLREGDRVELGDLRLRVLELPGHTLGHIAFVDDGNKRLFSGDVLFGLGCGRLFEGSHEQAFASLGRLKELPDETEVYCTHEYTTANLRFCLQNWPADFAEERLRVETLRSRNLPTVPLLLGREKRLNPFLTAKTIEEFRQRREARNIFRHPTAE